jgi:hypothetical protein
MSHAADGASAAAAEAAVNSARPSANIRRRPSRSPSIAPASIRTPNVSTYALIVQPSCSTDAPRSARIVARAVVTTRLSSATMNAGTQVRASAAARCSVIGPPVR